ncbi:MAG TPA: sugar phosphate isomerase/epimerase [Gaiellaceae bacterium]|nr:sugar phosphate isomerase/epimerase [Gaiellaceae bacterium]
MNERDTLSRRGFIGMGAGFAALAAFGGAGTRSAAAGPRTTSTRAAGSATPFSGAPLLPAGRIGIQLYSVRDAIADLGFAKVFEALAAIGYKQIEFAGYTQGTTPEITLPQLRRLLAANGLSAIGSHLSLTPSDDAAMEQALDDAEILGLPQIGVSLVVPGNTTVSGWQSYADTCNRYGALAAKRGMRFYLHNHFQEWAPTADDPSRRGEDVLLAETDPKLVWFELDIYWAHVGAFQSGDAFDPLLDYAIPYRNRYLLFHVKDGKKDASGGYADPFNDIVDVGEGEIDFATFFSTLFHQASGEKLRHWYIQERDNASDHPRGPLAASQCSYLFMRHGIVGR